MDRTVAIIIPVFNAYDDLVNCLDSVTRHTAPHHSVWLMDDASADDRIPPLLQTFQSQRPNVHIHRNPTNLGFVANCNRAFQQLGDRADVVLLNSDVMVTHRWLDKLIQAAYSHDRVGTVTPLTNNGTICSVPEWLADNAIPEGFTRDRFADLIDRISLRQYPIVPTAVGFCMYIKGAILAEIGHFDERHFGKGYGEENDFSCRVIKAGYTNIVDDSTWVYHAGGKSFGNDKKDQLIENNLKKLDVLHPEYRLNVQRFIESQPLTDILQNIKLHLDLDAIKAERPILFLTHNDITQSVNAAALGGTEYHCAALVQQVSGDRPCLVAYHNSPNQCMTIVLYRRNQIMPLSFPCTLSRMKGYLDESSEFVQLFTELLAFFNVSLVHIHHLMGLPLRSVLDGLHASQTPYLVSLHDYYLICPSYNLLDYQGKFCFEHKTSEYCQQCIEEIAQEGSHLRQEWRDLCYQFLNHADLLIYPSQSCQQYFQREYGALDAATKVIPHGIYDQGFYHSPVAKFPELSESSELPSQLSTAESAEIDVQTQSKIPLQVAIVGAIDYKKGAQLLETLLTLVWDDPALRTQIEFHFFGSFNGTLPPQVQNVQIRGRYEKEDLPTLLEPMDIALLPVVWPETYSLVADEILIAQLPILTTPIGAIADRVQTNQVGWVSQACTAQSILEELRHILENLDQVPLARSHTQRYAWKTIDAMVQEYQAIYTSYGPRSHSHRTPDVEAPFQVFLPEMIYSAYVRYQMLKGDHAIAPQLTSATDPTGESAESAANSVSRISLSQRGTLFKKLKEVTFPVWELTRKLAIRLGLIH